MNERTGTMAGRSASDRWRLNDMARNGMGWVGLDWLGANAMYIHVYKCTMKLSTYLYEYAYIISALSVVKKLIVVSMHI